jgi:hypothetical protein
MADLHLVLKWHWYDMIERGEKREEYRELKKFYMDRLSTKKYDKVVFHKGYSNETMTFDIISIEIGKGKEELGAETNKDYFVIKFK